MSRSIVGLLSTPDQSHHVVTYASGSLRIFMIRYESVTIGAPLVAQIDDWIERQHVQGAECAALIPAWPMPVSTYAKVERVAGVPRIRPELRGMAPQPWAGLVLILKAILDGDPTAPRLPDGYRFNPATTVVLDGPRADC